MKEKAVVAQWQNEEETRAFMLQANGDLVEITRRNRSDVWSPPKVAGTLQAADEHFSFVGLVY